MLSNTMENKENLMLNVKYHVKFITITPQSNLYLTLKNFKKLLLSRNIEDRDFFSNLFEMRISFFTFKREMTYE